MLKQQVPNVIPHKMKMWMEHAEDSEFCVTLRLTEKCTLSCIYCYAVETTNSVMTCSTLEKLFLTLSEVPQKRIKFIWHGGEPLMMDLSFLQNIKMLQGVYLSEKVVLNTVQTNGVIPDKKNKINWLAENDVAIGLSYDGCEELQNLHRPSRCSSISSYDELLETMALVKEKTGTLTVIQVVTPNSLSFLENCFKSYSELGVDTVKYLPYMEFIDGVDHSLSAAGFTEFLLAAFELWTSTYEELLDITNFTEIFRVFSGGKMRSCCNNGMCLSHLMVNQVGDVYSCSRMSFDKEHLLGNVFEKSMMDIVASGKYREIVLDHYSDIYERCHSCEWYSFCYGGCHSHVQNSESFYCNTNKVLFPKVIEFCCKNLSGGCDV